MICSLSAIAHTSRDYDVLGKFRLLHYQAPFVISLLANKPKTIILMVNRRVQVKVFLISKKRPSRISLAGNATDRPKFLTAVIMFLLDGLRDDLSWNASKGS